MFSEERSTECLLILIYSTRKIVVCNEEGSVYLYNWNEDECVNNVDFLLYLHV